MAHKQVTHDISEFGKEFKKLFKLKKPRSSIVIELMTDDLPDEWLIDIVRYRNKSGVVVDTFLITNLEIEMWLNMYKKDGYEVLTVS